MIRNEWGKIVRDMGMSIRPSFRETVVEPAGEDVYKRQLDGHGMQENVVKCE